MCYILDMQGEASSKSHWVSSLSQSVLRAAVSTSLLTKSETASDFAVAPSTCLCPRFVSLSTVIPLCMYVCLSAAIPMITGLCQISDSISCHRICDQFIRMHAHPDFKFNCLVRTTSQLPLRVLVWPSSAKGKVFTLPCWYFIIAPSWLRYFHTQKKNKNVEH